MADACFIEQAISWTGHSTVVLFNWVKDALNSNFGVAATGSFFGAVGGFFLVEYNSYRKSIYAKVIAINIAISLSLDIFNTMLSFKKQHVKKLYEDYLIDRQKVFEVLGQASKSGPPTQVSYLGNFKTLMLPKLPTELLYTNVQEKINLAGKALMLISVLVRVIDTLRDCTLARQNLIKEVNAQVDEFAKVALYFGFANGSKLDERYIDTMQAIQNLTDDSIMFSFLLIKELTAAGEKTRKKILISRPIAAKPTIKVVEDELMPKEENYRDWIDNFKGPQ